MAPITCPHCQKEFAAAVDAAAKRVRCPHCQQPVEAPAPRWYYARNKKKHGPYTWQQLLSLAEGGEVGPGDMLLREGARQWVRADTLPALRTVFASMPVASKPTPPRSFPWLIASIAGAGVCALLGLGVIGFMLLVLPNTGRDKQPANPDRVAEKKDDKAITDSATKKEDDPPKKTPGDDKKTPPGDKKQAGPPRETDLQLFVMRLNLYRRAAGMGTVALDAELSKACAEFAIESAKNLEKADGYDVTLYEPLAALERWMGRLASRTRLLNPDVTRIGIAIGKDERGSVFCVADLMGGRGEPTVVFPAPDQADVPISFSGGADIPDPKAAAGFPITVSFPQSKKVTATQIELRDSDSKSIDGWTWTPEKPLRSGRSQNTLAFIAKGLLRSSTLYHAKASAQVDGKAWSLAWSFTTDDDSDSKGVWAKKALDKVNAYRIRAGLKPVALDDQLSKGCLAHARYLVLNEGNPALEGLSAHDEDPKLPGFSEAGRAAGKASDIAIGDYEPIDGLDGWMATLYHRVPILEPNLRTIGFGCARGRRQGWVTVLNVGTGRDRTPRPHAVFYPVPDQVGVPLNFPNGGEEPNPIPESKTGRAGFPITVFFAEREPLQNATGRLTDAKGEEVPFWFSAPEKPANPKFAKYQGNTVCLIAKRPLIPDTTYQVSIQGTLAGKPWEKKWKFTTADIGLTVQTATQSVLERLNVNRATAGLTAVVLDDKLSRGCQLHAEYLVKNTDVLMKTNASVNEEDPQLPWYTLEGARVARQSLVFTNAPTPVLQIDDLMGTFSNRVYLLDPALQRVGVGCAHDIGRGWRCVLEVFGGRGDARVLMYPAPKQTDVPTMGFEMSAEAKGDTGFPISVAFPATRSVRNVQAILLDSDQNKVEVALTTTAEKSQRNVIGVIPMRPLQAGRAYDVTVSAIVNGAEWRQTWQFSTRK